MELLLNILAIVFGACLGSFANAVAVRWHESSSLLERSRCPQCRRTIRPHHLIPIVSWMLLRGKCADCGKSIHIQYPTVEAISAMFAFIALVRHPLLTEPWGFAGELIFTIALLIPIVMDLRWQELPVEFLIGLAVVGFGVRYSSPVTQLLSAVGGYLFFAIQDWVSKGRWVGKGDAYFGLMMGATLGFPGIVYGLYVAYILGSLVGVVGLATKLLSRKSRVPFAPALAVGTLCVWWYEPIIQAFFHRILS